MIKKAKKRFITLIEMMIVMFLIAMITGVIAYNYRGSLDEGKAFKTKAGIEKLQTILTLKLAEEGDFDVGSWKQIIEKSPLVHDAKSISKDGWGGEYQVSRDEDGNIVVTSQNYTRYQERHGNASMFTGSSS